MIAIGTIVQWFYVIILVFFVIACTVRWQKIKHPSLTDLECQELSSVVLQSLFEVAPGADKSVRLSGGFWRQLNLTGTQSVYLCRWMVARGMISIPGNWGLIDVLIGSPPLSLALTQKTMGLLINESFQPNIVIGDGNGPINFHGQQVVVSGQKLTGEALCSLVNAIRDDAGQLPELKALQAYEAADLLEKVITGEVSEESPEARGAFTWVRRRASEAVGNAAGSALWAGTIAAAKALGLA